MKVQAEAQQLLTSYPYNAGMDGASRVFVCQAAFHNGDTTR